MKLIEIVARTACKNISFDIFDTLLLRPFASPKDLFEFLGKKIGDDGFAKARIKAEELARQETNEEEISFDDIYTYIDAKYKDVKQLEVDSEEQLLQPNQEAKEAFDLARRLNKDIYIISDMYLDKNFIEKLLEKKGFAGYSKLYVSSFYKKTKRTGTLFRQFICDNKLSESDVLHIGDNEWSDYRICVKLGLNAYHYINNVDKHKVEDKRLVDLYSTKSLSRSLLIGLNNIGLHNCTEYWERIGFNFAGPVTYFFAKWIYEKSKEINATDILFIGRDGFYLQQVFKLFEPSGIKEHYCYCPRYFSIVCCNNLREKKDLKAGRILVNRYNKLFGGGESIDTKQDLEAFFSDKKDQIQKLIDTEKKNYRSYVEGLHLKGKKILVVDSCSRLLSAQNTLETCLSEYEIVGAYWTVPEINEFNKDKKFFTFEESRTDTFLDWNIMEFFFSEPIPSVEAIENGKVIYRQANQFIFNKMMILPKVGQGILRFATTMLAIEKVIPIAIQCKELTDLINAFCKYCDDKDKVNFSQIKHSWDVNHSIFVPVPWTWYEQDTDNSQPNVKIKKSLFNIIMLYDGSSKIKKYKLGKVTIYKTVSKNYSKIYYIVGVPIFKRNINCQY